MSRKTVAENLTRLVSKSHLSMRELATSIGLNEKTLWRWMQDGIEKTNGGNGEKLERLCQKLGTPVGALWSSQLTQAEICAEKTREMVKIWEQEGIGFDWIHVRHCAAIAVRRLKQEAPEIWQLVRRVKRFSSDRETHIQLELEARNHAKKVGTDAEAIYKWLYGWAAYLAYE